MSSYTLTEPAQGFDCSKWQGLINWQLVESDFVIIRAGNHYTIDQYAFPNYAQALVRNIPLGFYWYYTGKSMEDIKKETQAFIEWLQGKYVEMPVCIDLEDPSYKQYKKADVNAWIMQAATMLENAGYYVCVYSNKDWYDNMLDETVKSKFDIWYARWTSTGYKDHQGIKLWQKSNIGRVTGIDGEVDLDTAFIDYPGLLRDRGLNHLNG